LKTKKASLKSKKNKKISNKTKSHKKTHSKPTLKYIKNSSSISPSELSISLFKLNSMSKNKFSSFKISPMSSFSKKFERLSSPKYFHKLSNNSHKMFQPIREILNKKDDKQKKLIKDEIKAMDMIFKAYELKMKIPQRKNKFKLTCKKEAKKQLKQLVKRAKFMEIKRYSHFLIEKINSLYTWQTVRSKSPYKNTYELLALESKAKRLAKKFPIKMSESLIKTISKRIRLGTVKSLPLVKKSGLKVLRNLEKTVKDAKKNWQDYMKNKDLLNDMHKIYKDHKSQIRGTNNFKMLEK